MNPTIVLGARCAAQDSLGNRCHKSADHHRSAISMDRRHDASRGAVLRHWG